jgi:hypothetical protein
MKTYWGVEVQLHAFLTSALDGGEWLALFPGRFTSKITRSNHWIGGWVGNRASLDTVAKRKTPITAPAGNWTPVVQYVRGPFAKFVDSLYYSESELYGSAVTVSFSKYLPWQAMYFLQRSTHFLKTCCRPLINSKFLALELPFHGWKSSEIAWGEIWTVWRMF